MTPQATMRSFLFHTVGDRFRIFVVSSSRIFRSDRPRASARRAACSLLMGRGTRNAAQRPRAEAESAIRPSPEEADDGEPRRYHVSVPLAMWEVRPATEKGEQSGGR